MSIAVSARIHPTVVIDPRAEIGERVEIGPYCVIDGLVRIGADCIIRPHVHLVGELTLGCRNQIGTGSIIGEAPQHLQYKGEPTRTVLGDGNIIREHVVIHRGTTIKGVTTIGNNNFLMAHSHVAHDCTIGNNIVMANGALVAGHCEVFDRAFLSGNSAIHQFSRVGRFAMISGCSCSTKDVLPFMLVAERNRVVGINSVAMRRADLSAEAITVVRRAYQILFRTKMIQQLAVARLERELGHHPLIQEMLQFIQTSKRGFIGPHHCDSDRTDAEAA